LAASNLCTNQRESAADLRRTKQSGDREGEVKGLDAKRQPQRRDARRDELVSPPFPKAYNKNESKRLCLYNKRMERARWAG